MGFNEPEMSGQANLTPAQGATAWMLVETTYPERKLVSPSVLDLQWLIDWRAAYYAAYGRDPRVDAIGVHWYYQNDGDPLRSLQRQVEKAELLAQQWGVSEIWLTEWALYPCWGFDTPGFLLQAVEWLKTRPLLKRAFWFQVYMSGSEPWAPGPECDSSLVTEDDVLTAIGQAFKSMVSLRWDAQSELADINKDGKVDILDLSTVAARFGDEKP
jgi:hypothetical protein